MCSARRNIDRARHCGPSIAQAPAARRAAQHARASTAEGEPPARAPARAAGRARARGTAGAAAPAPPARSPATMRPGPRRRRGPAPPAAARDAGLIYMRRRGAAADGCTRASGPVLPPWPSAVRARAKPVAPHRVPACRADARRSPRRTRDPRQGWRPHEHCHDGDGMPRGSFQTFWRAASACTRIAQGLAPALRGRAAAARARRPGPRTSGARYGSVCTSNASAAVSVALALNALPKSTSRTWPPPGGAVREEKESDMVILRLPALEFQVNFLRSGRVLIQGFHWRGSLAAVLRRPAPSAAPATPGRSRGAAACLQQHARQGGRDRVLDPNLILRHACGQAPASSAPSGCSSSRFSGFRSACTTPRACSAATAPCRTRARPDEGLGVCAVSQG